MCAYPSHSLQNGQTGSSAYARAFSGGAITLPCYLRDEKSLGTRLHQSFRSPLRHCAFFSTKSVRTGVGAKAIAVVPLFDVPALVEALLAPAQGSLQR